MAVGQLKIESSACAELNKRGGLAFNLPDLKDRDQALLVTTLHKQRLRCHAQDW